MHFCEKCDNMYYIKIDMEDNLIYYCRRCNHENKTLAKNHENLCVSKLNINEVNDTYQNIINEYTKLDPTLPRINYIKCPNCNINNNNKSTLESKNEDIVESNNDDNDSNVIYIRYNDIDMKYVYLCEKCNHVWKIE